MSIDIKPYKHAEYSVEQSKFPQVPRLPARLLMVAPSGSGKTVLLTNLILNVYRNCFSRIYIFSPSIFVDSEWDSVKKHLKMI